MGAPNFEKQKMFDLYVIPSFDEEVDFDMFQDILDSINCDLATESEELEFFMVGVVGGRYEGLQVLIEPLYHDFDPQDEWSCKYFYEDDIDNVARRYVEEIVKINNKLLPKIARTHDLVKLRVVGTFSNGDAIYELD